MSTQTTTVRPLLARTAHVGPGGWRCPCCAPHSNKNGARTMLRRQGKKRERAEARRTDYLLIKADVIAAHEEWLASEAERHAAADAWEDECERRSYEADHPELDEYISPYFVGRFWPSEVWEYSLERDFTKPFNFYDYPPHPQKFETWVAKAGTVQWLYDRWYVAVRGECVTLPETLTLHEVQQYAELLYRLMRADADDDLPF